MERLVLDPRKESSFFIKGKTFYSGSKERKTLRSGSKEILVFHYLRKYLLQICEARLAALVVWFLFTEQ